MKLIKIDSVIIDIDEIAAVILGENKLMVCLRGQMEHPLTLYSTTGAKWWSYLLGIADDKEWEVEEGKD